MKSAARATIIAAVGLSLLALCPRAAFSQSKMAPENISSGVSKPPLAASGKSSNKKDNTIHLYSGDTLRLSSIAAPGAKKMRLVSITANNSRAVGKGNHSMVVSTSGGPGSYKGAAPVCAGQAIVPCAGPGVIHSKRAGCSIPFPLRGQNREGLCAKRGPI